MSISLNTYCCINCVFHDFAIHTFRFSNIYIHIWYMYFSSIFFFINFNNIETESYSYPPFAFKLKGQEFSARTLHSSSSISILIQVKRASFVNTFKLN